MHLFTPLIQSSKYSKLLNKNIYYKMDCRQPSGSFKIRGIGLLCQKLVEDGFSKFVIASGGNAGLAVAYSAKMLGIEAVVVVPESTKESMRKKIIDFGARLIVKGKVWNEAHEFASELVSQDEKAFYVHPFDHPVIWEGHATIIEELAQEMEEPDAIILSVGGGGLFCGVMEGLEKVGWNHSKVICVETFGAASLAKSMEMGEQVILESIDSVATSLGAKKIADQAWVYSQNERVISHQCSDQDAINACFDFLDDQGVLVEPACGAALSVLPMSEFLLYDCRNVVIIVCGGSGTSLEDLIEMKKLFE
jgi:L-serine/L-threonine ammonia-lyase